MGSMTFQINDASTGGIPAVWVTITENGDGTLGFNVTQTGGIVGDLRGLFFDVTDESVLSTLKVIAASTDIRIGNDSITDLGEGANINGLTGTDKGYDVGIEIGTSGIGKDDIRSYSFTLDSTARDLTLQDFAHVDFAARLTSVGVVSGTRADSAKILENTSEAINLGNAGAQVEENVQVSGNVLDGVHLGGATAVTGWTGGAAGTQVALESEGDLIGTLKLNADGSYLLDAGAADELSEGENIVFNFSYSARNQDEATSWSTDSAAFTVSIQGRNDGPVALDDDAGSVEEGAFLAGSVTANDSDIDRLDTHQWSLVSFDGEGSLAMNEDGTWTYDAAGAYDHLNEGESIDLSFEYAMTDNHGASDTATVSFSVEGVGQAPTEEDSGEVPTDGGGDTPPQPVAHEGLSHGYWKNHREDWDIALNTRFEQFFGVDAGEWTVKYRGQETTVADILFSDALALQGNISGEEALAREATAAVLNAMDEDVTYRYSVEEIVALVQEAYEGESTKDVLIGVKDELEYNNTLGLAA